MPELEPEVEPEVGPEVEPEVEPLAVVSAAAASSTPSSTFADKTKELRGKGGGWLVQARKKKNSPITVGKEKSSSLEGVAPVVKNHWDLSVSRLSTTASPDKVKQYLQERGIDVKEVWVFDSKIQGTKSAKVRIALEHREKAKDGKLWPEHTRVENWLYKPKSERQSVRSL